MKCKTTKKIFIILKVLISQVYILEGYFKREKSRVQDLIFSRRLLKNTSGLATDQSPPPLRGFTAKRRRTTRAFQSSCHRCRNSLECASQSGRERKTTSQRGGNAVPRFQSREVRRQEISIDQASAVPVHLSHIHHLTEKHTALVFHSERHFSSSSSSFHRVVVASFACHCISPQSALCSQPPTGCTCTPSIQSDMCQSPW